MSTIVKIGTCVLGEGMPKICAPIVGRSMEEICRQAEDVKKARPDMVEWRMDFMDGIEEEQIQSEALKRVSELLDGLPLLCTFRTKAEGGEKEVSAGTYKTINGRAIRSGLADAIDVEFFLPEKTVKELIADAKAHQITVIGSNHDFQKTPKKQEIVSRLCQMQQLGMDVAKMAVMPQSEKDVRMLLEATAEMKEQHPQTPVITMSMGKMGVLSRMAGELFGSALTFGTVGQASAPGQIPVKELRKILEMLHTS